MQFEGTKDSVGSPNDWYNLLSLEAFFNDSYYNIEGILQSSVGRAIHSIYKKLNEKDKYLVEEVNVNEINKGNYRTYFFVVFVHWCNYITNSILHLQNMKTIT